MNLKRLPYKAWINQPSMHQEYHALHGKQVVVIEYEYQEDAFCTVYFESDHPAPSMTLPKTVLSISIS